MEQPFRRIAFAAKFLVLRIMFPLCLVFACLSERAAAVESGTSNATGTCEGNTCHSTTPIPGPQPPGSGNPNDYAMCGILYLAGGHFDLLQVAQIQVSGNSYQTYLQWTGGSTTAPVQLTWTCAYFREFSGVPAPSQAEMSFPAPVTASGGASASMAIAGLTNACTWAGVEGGLSPYQGTNPAVYTQVESSGNTLAGVQPTPQKGSSLSTYALCYTYTGKSPSVTYEFRPGSSITWGYADFSTSKITGEFTYDATGDLSAVNVKLAGTKGEGEDATYNLPNITPVPPPTKQIGVTNATGNYVILKFTGDLAGGSDSLNTAAGADEYCLGCGGGGAVLSTTAAGGVVVSSKPQPAWKYDYVGKPKLYQHAKINLPGIDTNKYWCFMTGVSGGATAFNAGLEMGPSVYAYNTTNKAGLFWNCLPFSQ